MVQRPGQRHILLLDQTTRTHYIVQKPKGHSALGRTLQSTTSKDIYMTLSYHVTFQCTSSFACSATCPSFGYVSNLAAAPRLCPLQLLLPARLPLHPLQLLLPVCIRFSCCSPLASDSAAGRCLRPLFSCCSPIASASTAAPRLRPIQQQLPDCVRFDCCSLPAVLEDSSPCSMFSNILC